MPPGMDFGGNTFALPLDSGLDASTVSCGKEAPSKELRTQTEQRLGGATSSGEGPAGRIHGTDNKFGTAFDRVAQGSTTRMIRASCQGPNANARCERFSGSVRREGLDHLPIVSERHLLSVLAHSAAVSLNRPSE